MPVICISRQYGSSGREIGEKLAKKLGIPCYDKLLVKKAADGSGISVSTIQNHEEQPEEILLSGNVFADTASIMNTFYSESQLVYEAERRTILSLADKGPCVMIGRCAAAILKRPQILSVFIYADYNDRISRVMRRNRLSEREAKQKIRKVDRLRRQYFDFYADTLWGMPESYDLMVSSSVLGVDGCVDVIAAAAAAEVKHTHE